MEKTMKWIAAAAGAAAGLLTRMPTALRLLVLLMALTLLPLGALANDDNKCGENLTWEFADGILTACE